MKIPILVCIDVEPDDRFTRQQVRADWYGFEKSFLLFSKVRDLIASNTQRPPSFNWFLRMDPQVEISNGSAAWVAEHYAAWMKDLLDKKDELGLHTHAYRWESRLKSWIVDHGDASWVEHCVKVSFQAFEGFFAKKCRSFRFGDRWMSSKTMRLIHELGARFDLTLEPGYRAQSAMRPAEAHTGMLPDFTSVPRRPYYPSFLDFRIPDQGRSEGLIAIPLTTAELLGADAWLCRCWRKLKFGHAVSKGPVYTTLYLNHYSRIFRKVVDQVLQTADKPYLVLIARTDIGLSRHYSRNLKMNIEYLMAHPLAGKFIFCTPADAVEILGVV